MEYDRLKIHYCTNELQLIDILTKPLKNACFEDLKGLMGMRRLVDMS